MLNFASERRLVERLRGIFGRGNLGAMKAIEDLDEERHLTMTFQTPEASTGFEDGHGDPAAGH